MTLYSLSQKDNRTRSFSIHLVLKTILYCLPGHFSFYLKVFLLLQNIRLCGIIYFFLFKLSLEKTSCWGDGQPRFWMENFCLKEKLILVNAMQLGFITLYWVWLEC